MSAREAYLAAAESIEALNGPRPAIAPASECAHYYIVRFFQGDRRPRRIKSGLTLTEAQAHCHDPETSSSTATSAAAIRYTARNGAWFDGYDEERGR